MKDLRQFIGIYPVSKTLRFELRPVGKTQEWIEKNTKEAFINRFENHCIAFNFDYEDKKDYYVIDDKLMSFLVDCLIKESSL